MDSADIIEGWPEESREAAQLVVDAYGEPHVAIEPDLASGRITGGWRSPVLRTVVVIAGLALAGGARLA